MSKNHIQEWIKGAIKFKNDVNRARAKARRAEIAYNKAEDSRRWHEQKYDEYMNDALKALGFPLP